MFASPGEKIFVIAIWLIGSFFDFYCIKPFLAALGVWVVATLIWFYAMDTITFERHYQYQEMPEEKDSGQDE